jgi:hypothetical protein
LNYEGEKANWEATVFQGKTYLEIFTETYPDISAAPSGRFIYPAGALGFSVAVFSSLAMTCVAFLFLRRKAFGAELGGPDGPKKASLLVCISFWLTYLALSIYAS